MLITTPPNSRPRLSTCFLSYAHSSVVQAHDHLTSNELTGFPPHLYSSFVLLLMHQMPGSPEITPQVALETVKQ